MKKLSLQSVGLFFAAAVQTVFLTGCENRFDLEDIPREAEIRTRSAVGETDNGREYLARTFNSSVGSNYLGVHVMACYADKDGTLL